MKLLLLNNHNNGKSFLLVVISLCVFSNSITFNLKNKSKTSNNSNNKITEMIKNQNKLEVYNKYRLRSKKYLIDNLNGNLSNVTCELIHESQDFIQFLEINDMQEVLRFHLKKQ